MTPNKNNSKFKALLMISLLATVLLGIFLKIPSYKLENPKPQSSVFTPVVQINEVVPSSSQNTETVLSPEIAHDSETSTLDEAESTESNESSISDECMSRIESQSGTTTYKSKWKDDLESFIFPWILDKTTQSRGNLKYTTNASLFLESLGQADYLLGRTLPKNEEDALRMLQTISEGDPENSAPLIYMALIYERQNKPAKTEELINKIKSTKYFESYVLSLSRELYERVENASDLLSAIGIASQLPIPNYSPLLKFSLKHKLAIIGEQLVKANYSPEQTAEFLDWMLIEYVIGA